MKLAAKLAAVRRTRQRRDQAETAYRDAILQARRDGHTLAQIGDAAGTTRQAVNQLLERAKDGNLHHDHEESHT